MFTDETTLQDLTGIEDDERRLIKAFMQGAVYCWVKNRLREPFAVRDLMGGANFEWAGTPLYVLFQKHSRMGKDDETAVKDAGKDLGHLTKAVLYEDKRTFVRGMAGLVRSYYWDGNEP